MRLFPSAVLILVATVATAPGAVAFGQTASSWRFGGAISAPGDILDAGTGKISLGLGFAGEAARVWPVRANLATTLVARIATAGVKGEQGGLEWDAGRAVILDVFLRAERAIRTRGGVFGGVGVAHWSGPENTAPFAGAGAVLMATEAGVSWRINESLQAVLTTNLTLIGADDTRQVASGTVWRMYLGVQRGL
jgi:hypothetical protein